jgi:hypothetical protein
VGRSRVRVVAVGYSLPCLSAAASPIPWVFEETDACFIVRDASFCCVFSTVEGNSARRLQVKFNDWLGAFPKEEPMRKVLLAALFSALCYQSVSAMSVDRASLKHAADTNSLVQNVQFYYGPHHAVKCYREFVIGPYVCHRIGHGWWL